jgi:hypothetical protein
MRKSWRTAEEASPSHPDRCRVAVQKLLHPKMAAKEAAAGSLKVLNKACLVFWKSNDQHLAGLPILSPARWT